MTKPANTRAIAVLSRQSVAFEVHEYDLSVAAGTYGEAVALQLGVLPEKLFKTLVAIVDDTPMVALVPVSGRLSLKALARAAGGKRATMAEPRDAERWTGYVTGGISPFGQTRRMPVFIDDTIEAFDAIFVSGGRRGIQIEVDPQVVVEILSARSASLTEA